MIYVFILRYDMTWFYMYEWTKWVLIGWLYCLHFVYMDREIFSDDGKRKFLFIQLNSLSQIVHSWFKVNWFIGNKSFLMRMENILRWQRARVNTGILGCCLGFWKIWCYFLTILLTQYTTVLALHKPTNRWKWYLRFSYLLFAEFQVNINI